MAYYFLRYKNIQIQKSTKKSGQFFKRNDENGPRSDKNREL